TDHVDRGAVRAAARYGGHVAAEHRFEHTREGVAVELAVDGGIVGVIYLRGLLFGHVPVGPKRAVRTRSAGRPRRTSAFAATSTSAVGPQMKHRAPAPRGSSTS